MNKGLFQLGTLEQYMKSKRLMESSEAWPNCSSILKYNVTIFITPFNIWNISIKNIKSVRKITDFYEGCLAWWNMSDRRFVSIWSDVTAAHLITRHEKFPWLHFFSLQNRNLNTIKRIIKIQGVPKGSS